MEYPCEVEERSGGGPRKGVFYRTLGKQRKWWSIQIIAHQAEQPINRLEDQLDLRKSPVSGEQTQQAGQKDL
jgi:hypothetical protein